MIRKQLACLSRGSSFKPVFTEGNKRIKKKFYFERGKQKVRKFLHWKKSFSEKNQCRLNKVMRLDFNNYQITIQNGEGKITNLPVSCS